MKELEKLAYDFNIQVEGSGKNGKIKKEDYIYPLRERFLYNRFGDNIPDHMQLMLQVKSPMLAMRIDSMKEEHQQYIWNSDDIYFEEKLNGARLWMVKTNSGLYLYSRHNSDVDMLPIEYTGQILYPDGFDIDPIHETFILDCELTCDDQSINTAVGGHGITTETQLQAVTAVLNCDEKRAHMIQNSQNIRFTFNVFDCVYYQGKWIMDEPLKLRRNIALHMYKRLESKGFKIKPVRSNKSNKKDFYKGIILSGGEGCVAKNINGIYVPDTTRNKDGWIKIKRSVSEMLGHEGDIGEQFGDTIDAFITGFELGSEGKSYEGMVKTIKLSINLQKKDGSVEIHEIARISGLDFKLLNDMTDMVGGVPTLKASYYNRVMEIDGAGISPRELRLNHAIMVGFRYDKQPEDCIMTEEFLHKMIL